MKQIIDNKLYDTDKCTLIIEYLKSIKHKGLLNEYPLYHKAKIYKTAKEQYLEYIGNPEESGYREHEKLSTITPDDVKKVLLDLNAIDKYIEEFGPVDEG